MSIVPLPLGALTQPARGGGCGDVSLPLAASEPCTSKAQRIREDAIIDAVHKASGPQCADRNSAGIIEAQNMDTTEQERIDRGATGRTKLYALCIFGGSGYTSFCLRDLVGRGVFGARWNITYMGRPGGCAPAPPTVTCKAVRQQCSLQAKVHSQLTRVQPAPSTTSDLSLGCRRALSCTPTFSYLIGLP